MTVSCRMLAAGVALAFLPLPGVVAQQRVDEELWRAQSGGVMAAGVLCPSAVFGLQEARACLERFLTRVPGNVKLVSVLMFSNRHDLAVYNWRVPGGGPNSFPEWLTAAKEMPPYQAGIAQGFVSGDNVALRYRPVIGPPQTLLLRGSDPALVRAGGAAAEILTIDVSGPSAWYKGGRLVSLTLRVTSPLSERGGRGLMRYLRAILHAEALGLSMRADHYFSGPGHIPVVYPFGPLPLPTEGEYGRNPTLFCAHDRNGPRCFSIPPDAVK